MKQTPADCRDSRTLREGPVAALVILVSVLWLWLPCGRAAAGPRRAAPATRSATDARTARRAETGPRRFRGRRTRPTEPVPGKPWLVWDRTAFDFGLKIIDGAPIVGEFTFRNEGDVELRIKSVQPSCDCTTTEYDALVAPGDRGRIAFEVDPAGMLGDGDPVKTIRVSTDCPGHPETVLEIRGQVVAPVEARPGPEVSFGRVRADQKSTKILDIVSNVDEPLKIVQVHSTNPCFQATIAPTPDPRRYRLKVVATPPYRSGRNAGTITLETNLALQPRLVVTASAVLVPRVSVYPAAVRIRAGETRTREYGVRLTNRGATAVDIDKVTLSDRRIQVVVVHRTRKAPPRVRLLVPAHYEVPKGGAAILTIETTDKEFKRFRIPIGTTRSLSASGVLDQLRGRPD